MDTVRPSNLSRRLFVSYALAFTVVLAVFAVSIRFAFVTMLERQVDELKRLSCDAKSEEDPAKALSRGAT